MGNVRPFGLDLIIHHAHAFVVAVILARDRAIDVVEHVTRQRFAFFGPLMDRQLEFREFCLSKDRPLDAFEIVAQQRQPDRVVLDLLEHMVDKKRLIKSRRHFGDKDRIVGRHPRLRPVRIVGLHRMSQLVRQRAHVVILTVIVHQHVGMHVVCGAV